MTEPTDEAFLDEAKRRVVQHLRARRDAGLYDTIVAVVEAPDGTLHEGTPLQTSQSQFDHCAERHALQAMKHASPGTDSFQRILVVGPVPEADHPVTTPCGGCRHAMHDLNPEATVFCSTVVREPDGWTTFPGTARFTVDELYPHHNDLPTWK